MIFHFIKTFFAIMVLSVTLLCASCGNSIHDAQDFVPNGLPSIVRIERTLPSGVTADTLGDGMTIKLVVTASDPEKNSIEYLFSSQQGSFSNIITTETGCTAEMYTRNVTGGGSVNITVSAKDNKGASDTWKDWNVGAGRSGPKVDMNTSSTREYIKPSADTSFSFSSTSEGYYQIVCDNSATESTITRNVDEPIFMYIPSGDVASPKVVTVPVVGTDSSSSGKVKLASKTPADNAPNKVWLIFWDGLNQYSIKLITVTQDSVAPTTASVTPANGSTGIGVSSTDIRVSFNEPVMIEGAVGTSPVSVTGPLGSISGTVSASGNDVAFVPGSVLKNYKGYAISAQNSITTKTITDLAGNEWIGSVSSSFTTVSLGKAPAPSFSHTTNTYDSAQNVTISSSESGADLRYTTSVGYTNGSAPSLSSSQFSSAIPCALNTTINAVSFVEGYEPSDMSSVTIKVRTAMPTINVSSTYLSSYPSDPTILYRTSGSDPITFSSTVLTAYYNSEITFDGTAPPLPVDPTIGVNPTAPTLTTDGCRIRIKAIAHATNMEPSRVYTSSVYRIRELARPNAVLSVPETGYPIIEGSTRTGPEWKKVAMSSTGQYIAAIETSTATSPNGYIWTSDDYGVTWNKRTTAGAHRWTGVAMSSNSSAIYDGKYIVACENNSNSAVNGNIWYSSDYGASFAVKTSTYHFNWRDVTINGDGSKIAATEINSFSGSAGYIWVSTNSGINWIKPSDSYNSPAMVTWNYISAASSTFDLIMGIGYGPFLWLSSSTTLDCPSITFTGLAYSGNGSTYAASRINNYIYSNRSGTWTNVDASGAKTWSCVSLSYDGSKIYGGVAAGHLFRAVSANQGTPYSSWSDIKNDAIYQWSSIASNGDGTNLAASVNEGDIWTGNYNGTSWGWAHQGLRTWTGVACSSNGQYIVACDGGAGGHGGYIYTSNDGGNNWTEKKTDNQPSPSPLFKQWAGIAMSKDGLFIAAIAGKEMYYSTNGGNNWIKYGVSPASNFTRVSVSGISGANARAVAINGNYYFMIDGVGNNITGFGASAVSNVNDVYVANDASIILFTASGTSILKAEPSGGIATAFYSNGHTAGRITASDDLSKVYFSTGSSIDIISNITSTPSFITINPTPSFLNNSIVSSSFDGKLITSVSSDGYLYSSIDSGTTWTKQTTATGSGWNCVATTSDGLTIFAGDTKHNYITVLK